MKRGEDLRPERLEQAGVDIARISETEVLVVTDDFPCGEPWNHPVWALCRALGALGFGCVHLRGAVAYRDDLSLMMEGFPFTQATALWLDDALPARAAPCEVVLQLGSDPGLRDASARLAGSRSSHFAALSWGASWVAMESLDEVLHDAAALDPNSALIRAPLAPVARVAAGLALQETLIAAGGLGSAAPPDPLVSFDAAAETRRHQAASGTWSSVSLESSIVDVIGAGAVGTHFLECFGPLLGRGCELRIYDFDAVGPENLGVQAAFSPEDVGRAKAVAVAEKLAPMCDPALALRPMVMRYEERPTTLAAPSLRVACPDNFAARKYANDCAIADGVPLVEAGSSPLAAQERTYLPGRTACIQHRIPNLSERAAGERERASCSLEHAFTLPGTNMICAGILAAEALRALQPETFGWPSTATVAYDAHFPERFGLVEPRPACFHPSTQGP